ncbi:disulfide bond formation protein B [Candidatus Pacearchaeota archaeon]|nr:disulfide bond formation protein B [Candidatus Pacearchaeota archaeon]|tara:strand:- start:421 stop:984 length:564 start_codon:yes stop_codon:yes gene_type:complete
MVKELIASGIEILTVISTALIGLLLLLFILKFVFRKDTDLYKDIVHFLQDHYLIIGFIVSLVATLGSLFYSDIMGYNPCKLCWYQRIFMYPQVILFGIALKTKRKSIIANSMWLSGFGFLIAAYHYLIQIGVMTGGCDVVGYSAKCSEFFSLAYGFVTIPFMALIAFAILLIIGYGKLRDCKARGVR